MKNRIDLIVLLLVWILAGSEIYAQVPEGGVQLNATTGTTWLKYGNGTAVLVDVEGQEFSKAIEMSTGTGMNNVWDAQLKFPSAAGIEEGDVVLVAFYARCTSSEQETGEGFLNVIIELSGDPYTKELNHSLSIGSEWKEYYARARITNTRSVSEVSYLFHMGFESQTVEVAEVRYLNYKNTLELEDLPITKTTYIGQDPDAAWRAPAAERIEQFRKGVMEITVLDGEGNPVPGAIVDIEMKQHSFGFGSAVVAGRILREKTYRDTMFSMFNEIVFENDLKWGPFLDVNRRKDVLMALDTLDYHGVPARGHNIIWPSWKHMPASVQELKDDPQGLRNEIDNHFDEVVSFTKGRLIDWDVMNEPYTEHDVQDILGDEVMAHWYSRPQRIDRGVKLYMNEFSIISGGGKNQAKQDYYYQLIQDIEAMGGTIHGIGMQGHFASDLTPIEKIWEITDRFAGLGKEIKITEFDINMDQREVQAEYTRDFMTILFSHPSVKAILTWGFWENAHWKPDAAFFEEDWSIRPHGEMWRKMSRETWWTPAMQGMSDDEGKFVFEGFLGTYSYAITTGDSTRTGSFDLDLPKAGAVPDTLVLSMDAGIPEELVITPSEEGFICEGQEVVLRATIGEGLSYTWTLDGEALQEDTSVIIASAPGAYQVSAKKNGISLVSVPYQLEVRPVPEATIAYVGEASFCPGSIASLYAVSADEGSYEWYSSEDRVQWGRDTLETDLPEYYHLEVTRDACSGSSNELSLTWLSADDPSCTTGMGDSKQEESRIFPNPCKGYVNVELPCKAEGGRVELYDVRGRLVSGQSFMAGESLITLSVPGKGIHMLRIMQESEILTYRLVAE